MSESHKKLPADGTVDSGMITDGTIVNADVNSSAAIVQSKLSLDDASDSAKGVASFDENDFLVTSGDVTKAARTRYRVGVPGGLVENLGITLSGGTLTIAGADSTALSATNPAWIAMQDNSSPGQLKTYEVTANQNFIDDAGSSEIIGNLFGLTTSIAHADAIPFYLYAVTSDDEASIAFMISRVPGKTTSPATAAIGAPDDAVADTQISFWSLDNIDETLYDTNACVMIGSFRMVMSASDDWTVQALDVQDGIGQFQQKRIFTMSAGQYGAASGKYFTDNGGTAPGFTTSTVTYTLDPFTQKCNFVAFHDNTSVAGVGTGSLEVTIPLQQDAATHPQMYFSALWTDGVSKRSFHGVSGATAANKIGKWWFEGESSSFDNEDVDLTDDLHFNITYKIAE